MTPKIKSTVDRREMIKMVIKTMGKSVISGAIATLIPSFVL